MKITDLGWLSRSLPSSTVGYPSDSWASCIVLYLLCRVSTQWRLLSRRVSAGGSRSLQRASWRGTGGWVLTGSVCQLQPSVWQLHYGRGVRPRCQHYSSRRVLLTL